MNEDRQLLGPLSVTILKERAAGSSAPACLTEPCRRAFSREEMIEEAKSYMRETWGPCRESEERDRWHERLGMLVDFIHDRFPANATAHVRAVASNVQPLVLCDHHDRCPHPDFNCEHRTPHTPTGDCERGGDCGNKPGILEWCKCVPQNAGAVPRRGSDVGTSPLLGVKGEE